MNHIILDLKKTYKKQPKTKLMSTAVITAHVCTTLSKAVEHTTALNSSANTSQPPDKHHSCPLVFFQNFWTKYFSTLKSMLYDYK